jgi:hypothetical protein
MNIKELFDNTENGTLTYEQFQTAMANANAKFVDLSEGGYVDKQKYTDDLNARDVKISGLESTISTRDTDLQNLRTQLENAGTDATKLGELNTSLTNLQTKYDKDTKDLQRQLKEQAYKFAVDKFVEQQKFTSNAAKRDFTQSLLSKKLSLENDTIVGANDFMTLYAAENADAFVVDTPDPTPAPTKPTFVQPTGQGAPTKPTLTELMMAKNNNPDLNITW